MPTSSQPPAPAAQPPLTADDRRAQWSGARLSAVVEAAYIAQAVRP